MGILYHLSYNHVSFSYQLPMGKEILTYLNFSPEAILIFFLCSPEF